MLNNRRQRRVTHTHSVKNLSHTHAQTCRQCTFCICFHYVVWVGMSQYPVCGSPGLFSDITEYCGFAIVLYVCVLSVSVCVSSCHPITQAHIHNHTPWATTASLCYPLKFPFICEGSWNNISCDMNWNNEKQNLALKPRFKHQRQLWGQNTSGKFS